MSTKLKVTPELFKAVKGLLGSGMSVKEVLGVFPEGHEVSKMTVETINRADDFAEYKKIRHAYSNGYKYVKPIKVQDNSRAKKVAVRQNTALERELMQNNELLEAQITTYNCKVSELDKECSRYEMRLHRVNTATLWERLKFLFKRIEW